MSSPMTIVNVHAKTMVAITAEVGSLFRKLQQWYDERSHDITIVDVHKSVERMEGDKCCKNCCSYIAQLNENPCNGR